MASISSSYICGELTLSGSRVELYSYAFASREDKRNIDEVIKEMFTKMKQYEGYRASGEPVYLKDDIENACTKQQLVWRKSVASSVRLHMSLYQCHPSTPRRSPFIYETKKVEENTGIDSWHSRRCTILAAAADPLNRIRSLSFVPSNPCEQQTWFYQKNIFCETEDLEEKKKEVVSEEMSNKSPHTTVFKNFIKPFDDFDSKICAPETEPFPSNVRVFILDPKNFDAKKTPEENVGLIASQVVQDIKEEEQDTKEETLSSRIRRIVWYFFNDMHALELRMVVQHKDSLASQIHLRKELG